MQRIKCVDPDKAQGRIKELLEGVKKSFGRVPNGFQIEANSEAVLEGLLGFMGGLNKSLLPFEVRDQIILAVSELNGCPYCLSAFTALGKGAGVSDKALEMCRIAASDDPKIDAALKFAKAIVQKRGAVSDEDFDKVKSAGYSDAEILEIVANVAFATFINYLNLVTAAEIDWPLVMPRTSKV